MCQPGTHEPDLYSKLRKGLKLDLLGERWRAIQALEALLQKSPEFSEARGHLSWIYSLQGNLQSAVRHLHELLRTDPTNREAEQRIAELETLPERLMGKCRDVAAIKSLASHLADDTSRRARSSHRDALILYRILWKDHESRDAAVWVSRLSYGLQDFRTCLESTEACLNQESSSLEFLKRLGLVFEQTGKNDDAVRVYRKILERDPDSWGIVANLKCLDKDSSESFPENFPLARLFSSKVKPPGEGSSRPVSGKPRGTPSWIRRFYTMGDPVNRLAARLSRNPGFRNRPCNLCGEDQFRGVAVGRENGWPIMRCTNCGLIQTHPQPTQETLTSKYQEEYYEENSIQVARDIHEAAPIGEVPMTMLPRVMDFLIECGLENYERSRTERRLLDIGCGEGVLMRDFRNRGWNCEGTEVSGPVIEFLKERGYGVHEGLIADLDLPHERYDLITLSHVIEHVRDPLGDLKRSFSLLSPGGWLFVTTPGADSIPCDLAGADWFYDPDHIFFFSRATLKRMMESAGFQVFGESTYVGAGRETWETTWLNEGLGPAVRKRIEDRNEGDVLLMVGRKR